MINIIDYLIIVISLFTDLFIIIYVFYLFIVIYFGEAWLICYILEEGLIEDKCRI